MSGDFFPVIEYDGGAFAVTGSDGYTIFAPAGHAERWRTPGVQGLGCGDERAAQILGIDVVAAEAIANVSRAVSDCLRSSPATLAWREQEERLSAMSEKMSEAAEREGLSHILRMAADDMKCKRESAEAPPDIAGIPGLRPHSPCESCVYFLIDRGIVVYVGQTTRGADCRIASHRRDKKFDTVFVAPTPPALLNAVEAHWIKALEPEYNVAGKPAAEAA